METDDAEYAAVFTVGETVYNVTGVYNGKYLEEDIFVFEIPIEDLRPAESPVEFYGMMWSGSLTETSDSGYWSFNSESAFQTPAGEFTLERQP